MRRRRSVSQQNLNCGQLSKAVLSKWETSANICPISHLQLERGRARNCGTGMGVPITKTIVDAWEDHSCRQPYGARIRIQLELASLSVQDREPI
jgi:hypothetical protein